MANRTWKDTDLSAYVDGELDPETHQALEARLTEDPALQRRLDAFVEVSNLVRTVPMREPPRNYLLTPEMVAEPEPEASEQRPGLRLPLPMWAMRLATSLTAAAFVVTLSLSLFQQGLSPTAMMEQADSQPRSEMVRLESEATPTVEIQALQAEEAAPVEKEAPQRLMPTPSPQATLTAKEEMALEAMPGAQESVQEGMGGGGEPPTAAEAPPEDTSVEATKEEADEAAEAEPEAADAVRASPTPEAARPEIATAEETADVPPETSAEEAEALGPPPTPPVEAPDRLLGPNRWRWLAVMMGALTAILGGLTIWMSRYHR